MRLLHLRPASPRAGRRGPARGAEVARFEDTPGEVDAAFTFARTMGCVLADWMIDRRGARRGFSIGLTGWSIAGVLHGLVNGVRGMPFTRFRLGRGETGNFPASIKSVAECFPRKERSFAPGLFNAGGRCRSLSP